MPVLRQLSMSSKFMLIGLSFTIPIAMLLYLFTNQIQGRIEFTERELRGTAYLRPLVALQATLREPQSADGENRAKAAWRELELVQSLHGAALQFTTEGLEKRGRAGLKPHILRARWDDARASGREPDLRAVEADLRKMITHAGDLSNLILDPDLDTYYLMDAVVLAVPELEGRLNRMSSPRAAEGSRMVFEAGLLKEVDLPRLEANTRTALVEDRNFGGILPTLQPRMEAALVELLGPQKELIAAIESGETDPGRLAVLRTRARWAGVDFWRVAAGELERLLEMRAAALRKERNKALGWTLLAILCASMLAALLLRSITEPLATLVQELGPESTAMRRSAERFAIDSMRQRLSEEDSTRLAEEMNQHALLIRRAVIELVAQIAGGARDLALRVEGVPPARPRVQ